MKYCKLTFSLFTLSLALASFWYTILQVQATDFGYVTSVDLSTDGILYVTGHSDGVVNIWDAETEELVLTVQKPEFSWMGPSTEFSVTDVVFKPGSHLFAVSFRDNHALGLIRILDAQSGVIVSEFTASDNPLSLDWNPAGDQLAVLARVGTGSGAVSWLSIFDEQGTEVGHQLTREAAALFVDWSPVDNRIAQISGTEIVIWDTLDWSFVTLQGHQEIITEAKWNFNGTKLASVDKTTVRIWDLVTNQPLTVFQKDITNGVSHLAWKPDGTAVASTSNTLIQGWSIQPEQPAFSIEVGYSEDIIWAAEERLLFASGTVGEITTDPVATLTPLADAGADQTIFSTGSLTPVNFDASGSSDPDGSIAEYIWTENSTQIGIGATPQINLSVGTHIITLTVVDNDGATDNDEVIVTITETTQTATPTNNPTETVTPIASPTNILTPTPSSSCSVTLVTNDSLQLINAINAANSTGSSTDTICLALDSTYQLNAIDNTTDGPNGLPSITSAITIVGNGATISRDPASPAFRIFHVAAGGNLSLDGVTISGGSATSAAPGNDGGAIYNRGTVNLIGNTGITNSTANADGGAVYNRGTFNIAAGSSIAGNTAADDGGGVYTSSGTLNVTGGTITDNTAGDEGGGIRSVDSTITLTNANITDNTATGGSGGGLYTTSTTLTVTNGVFSGNGGNSGGGLYFTNSPSAASLDGVQILNNTGTNGGGLYLTSSGQAALTSVTVSGNQATSSAAGIWSGGTLTLTDSLVSNNGNTSQPGSAGGIRAAGATLTVNDTVISGNLVNSSSGSGGGIYILSAGTALINGGEISGNDARNGGGLYNGGNLSLSSIIDDNAAQHYGGGLYITGGIAHVDGSVFSNNSAVDRGGAVYNGVTTTSWIHDSCITGNTSADTGGVYSNTAAFDAIDNWWGAATGPSGAGAGTGDAANSNVTFSPFLTAGCPSGTGEGSTQQLMGPQVQMRGAEATPTLAPVRVPFRATFEDEVDWYAGGTWVLDTLNGRNKAPSWTVNTSSRGEESVLEMRAPINLRGTQSPQLTFWERGQIAPSDVVTVEVLPEGASTWSVVDIRSTVASAWTQRSVSLSAYRGQTIQLRVRVVAGGELEDGTRSTGLWIDDWGVESR